MERTPTSDVDRLERQVGDAMAFRDARWRIVDYDALVRELPPQLAYDALWADGPVGAAAVAALWRIAQVTGTPLCSAAALIACLERDGIHSVGIPMFDCTVAPYEVLYTLCQAGNEMEVGTLVFHCSTSGKAAVIAAAQVAAAGVAAKWQGPLLWASQPPETELTTALIDWRHMLYFNSSGLPQLELDALLGPLRHMDFADIAPDQWRALGKRPESLWLPVQDALFDVFCDLFEEMDANETFALLKRYVIPTWDARTLEQIVGQ